MNYNLYRQFSPGRVEIPERQSPRSENRLPSGFNLTRYRLAAGAAKSGIARQYAHDTNLERRRLVVSDWWCGAA
jgi:hypothetical protein